MRTSDDLLNIIVKAQCCSADMAFKALKEEMFIKPDRVTSFKNVRYIQSLIGILSRYQDTVYNLLDTEVWLSELQIEDMIEQIQLLCDNCGCCTDAQELKKDI